MAHFRELDVALRLFPEVTEAVEQYRKIRSDREIRGIARGLANEEALYIQFARKVALLAQSSTYTGSLDKGSLEKLGPGTTDFILKGLEEMVGLLQELKAAIRNFSVSARVLKEIKKGPSSQAGWKTKTPFMVRLERLGELNSELVACLLDSQMPLPLPGETDPLLRSEFFHRVPIKNERAFLAVDGACDQAQDSDSVVLRCKCRRCNPLYDLKTESNDYAWDLEAFRLLKPTDKDNSGSPEPLMSRRESSTPQATDQQTPPVDKAINWVSLPLNNFDGRDDNRIQSDNFNNKVCMSLSDIISHHRSLFDHHQRMELCFRLSTSVLQLSSTTWINQLWSLDDFITVIEPENEHPRLFVRRKASPLQDLAKKDPAWSIIAREPILVRLGIHITELALGRSLADIRREESSILRSGDLKILDIDVLNLVTIRRLLALRIIAQRVSPDFQDVVSACINQQYRDPAHAKIQELRTGDPAFPDHAAVAILMPLYHEVHKHRGHNHVKVKKGAPSRHRDEAVSHADRKGRKHVPTPVDKGHGLGGDPFAVPQPQRPVAVKRGDGHHTGFKALPDHASRDPASALPDTQNSKSFQHGDGSSQPEGPSTISDCGHSAVLVPTRSDDTSGMPSKNTPESDSTEGQLVDVVSQSTPEKIEKRPRDDSDDASDYSYGTYTESTYSALAFLHPPQTKLPPNHPFLRFKELAIEYIFAHFQEWVAAGNGAGTSGQSAPANQGEPSRKRKNGAGKGISHGYDDDDDNDDDTSQQSPNFPRKRQRGERESPTFACPFLKKDPVVHKGCCMFVLSRIRDVKQHLRRRHQMPIYCPRCVKTFDNEDDRDEHVIEASCPRRPGKPDGITERQKKALSEKAPASQSAETQWFGIFRILFPDQHELPQSPYMDMESEIFRSSVMYQEFVLDQGPRLLSDLLTARGAVAWNNMPHEARDRTSMLHQILHEGLRNLFDRYLREGHGSSPVPNAAASSSYDIPVRERTQEPTDPFGHRSDRESTLDPAASIGGHFNAMNLDALSSHSHSLDSFHTGTYSTTTERSGHDLLEWNLYQQVIDEGHAQRVVAQQQGYQTWMNHGP